MDSSICGVGRVVGITTSGVTVDAVAGGGEPIEACAIDFETLTRVDCLGEYEHSFDL